MTTTSPQTDARDGFGAVSIVIAAVALFLALVGVGFGMRAIDEADDAGSGVRAGGGSPVPVELTDFAISPSAIAVEAGGMLDVSNAGRSVHNLAVKGEEDLTTSNLPPGESATLDVGDLEPGEYAVICTVPGHEASGMTAALTIRGDGGAIAGDDHAAMDWAEMDRVMNERAALYPATTEGLGATELAPVVGADGVKEFRLTASVFDWETEPGVTVEAWGYNEQVPGPTIRTEVGDRVRIVLTNELPESTALHAHGFVLPNEMDGVPPYTQDQIAPGETFTYEWTIREPMVGMYHSHHHAEVQVPNGMLGAFYAGDMPLPVGTPTPAVDMPMVLNDAGTIGLSLNGKSFPATAPVAAKVGDWVKLDYMNEGLQLHPMHLHGMSQLVIARDGYPLAQPERMDTVTVAPGERITVLVHATEPGVWAWHCHILNHAERSDGMFGMVTALIVE